MLAFFYRWRVARLNRKLDLLELKMINVLADIWFRDPKRLP